MGSLESERTWKAVEKGARAMGAGEEARVRVWAGEAFRLCYRSVTGSLD